MKIGVISGQVLAGFLSNPERVMVESPFGAIPVFVARVGKQEVFFVHRHGENPSLPPHRVNYRGNMSVLSSCGVSCVLSFGLVGSLKHRLKPGDVVVPHDFVDFTKSRCYSFFDKDRVHVDMSEALCPSLREVLLSCGKMVKGVRVHPKGVYVATEGPRLETPAEIKMFGRFADMVGMTLVPEVVLAREKGLCYVSLCLVCNMAAGLQHTLQAEELRSVFKQQESNISKILKNTIIGLSEKKSCHCNQDIMQATL